MVESNVDRIVDHILENVRQADSLIVCVGPQLSQSAGIPDLRSILLQQYSQIPEGRKRDTRGRPRVPPEGLSTRELAELVQSHLGRDGVVELLKSVTISSKASPTRSHRALSKLASKAIVTTNYDSLIEMALRDVERRAVVITRLSDPPPPDVEDDLLPLFKIYGSIDDPRSLLSWRDYRVAAEETGLNHWNLQTMFAASVVIAVGFALGSEELGYLYEQFGSRSGDWFVLATHIDPVSEVLWRNRGIRVVRVSELELPDVLDTLRRRRERGTDRASTPRTQQIFISAAREDLELASAVRELLGNMGLEAVTAADIPQSGRTIIEKFDQLVESSEAIIVIIGPTEGPLSESLRRQQDINFELGYAIGKHGRQRVLVIVSKEAEVPSDLTGVSYLVADPRGYSTLQPGLRKWALALGLPVAGPS